MSDKFKNKFKKDVTLDLEDIVPPVADDIEYVVLGALLLERDAFDRVANKMSEHLFFRRECFHVYKAIEELYKKNEPIDILTVTNQLRKMEVLGDIGGPWFISTLTNRVAGTGNLDYHVHILIQYGLKRRAMQIMGNGISMCTEFNKDVFDIYSEITSELETTLSGTIKSMGDFKPIGEIHEKMLTKNVEHLNNPSKMSGVASGLNRLDNFTNGFQKSDLIIIAGRPGMGKTAIAVCMSANPSINLNEPIGVFSLEMSAEQLVARIQSSESEIISSSDIVKMKMNREQVEELENRTKRLHKAPLYIDDTAGITIMELKSKARRLVKEKGVKMIIIDYLQLMSAGMPGLNREQEISFISRNLKIMAKELDIPVIALSQLSRSVETRGGDKKPMLSDLRESGSIEQDADMVMFCYRPEYYGFTDYEVSGNEFNAHGLFLLIIAKHRNGKLGEVPLRFIAQLTKIIDWDENYEEKNLENKKQGDTFVQQDTNSNSTNSALRPNNDFDKETSINDFPF